MERGEGGEERRGTGVGLAWTHFKWRGGWKAKRCTEREETARVAGKKAARVGARDWMWAKISA